MITVILSLLIPAAIVVGLVVVVVRRGGQLKQLCADGVDATGTVVAKIQYHTAKGTVRNDRWLRYEYQVAGVTHSHKSLVTSEYWNALTEGGPIEIVHSRSSPEISAPRHLVESARKALQKT